MRASITRRLGAASIAAAVVAGLLALAGPAAAASTIHVNTVEDQNGTGGKCSIREAVTAANTNAAFGGCPAGSGLDTIKLLDGFFRFSNTPGTEENANLNGDIDITERAIIKGAGPNQTIIDARGQGTEERGFHVMDAAVTFMNLQIRNGRDDTSVGGGGVYAAGDEPLKLDRVHLIANYGSSYGGGVAHDGPGMLKVTRSLVADNDTDGYGGGVYSYQNRLVIENSRIVGNTGDDGGGGVYFDAVNSGRIWMSRIAGNNVTDSYYGGGVYVETDSSDDTVTIGRTTIRSNAVTYQDSGYGGGIYHYYGRLLLKDSTVDGNFSSWDGGGIYTEDFVRITYSTISHNGATNDGGGIYQYDGDLNIRNSTITRNSAYNYAGGLYADGSDVDLNNVTIYRNQSYNQSTGIGFYEDGATVNFQNSIIARNRYEGSVDFYDCYGGTSGGNNLISDGVDCNTVGSDIFGDSSDPMDPRLGPLQDNGGWTFTHALLPQSPAHNAAGGDSEPRDQRHVMRSNPDIGAFEL